MIRTLVKEAVRNAMLLKSILRKMVKEIGDGIVKGPVEYDRRNVDHRLHLGNVPQEHYERVENIIKRYVDIMHHNGYIMSYSKSKRADMEWTDDLIGTPLDTFHVDFIITLKDQHTQRIKPQRYVYHFSPFSNRESILKRGLIPSPWSDSGNWSHVSDVAYNAAVFAVNTDKDSWGQKGWDRWRIDTSMIPNKWWHDMNFHQRPDLVMTHDAIPPEALRLA